MAGSTVGASSAYTDAGPPDKIRAAGAISRTSSAEMSHGTISEYTCRSRTRRAISCAYCAPKSKTKTFCEVCSDAFWVMVPPWGATTTISPIECNRIIIPALADLRENSMPPAKSARRRNDPSSWPPFCTYGRLSAHQLHPAPTHPHPHWAGSERLVPSHVATAIPARPRSAGRPRPRVHSNSAHSPSPAAPRLHHPPSHTHQTAPHTQSHRPHPPRPSAPHPRSPSPRHARPHHTHNRPHPPPRPHSTHAPTRNLLQ